jgi:uncharacterized protein
MEQATPGQDSATRIFTLDVIRGVAVMGILIMNINNWGLGRPGYWSAGAIGGADGANLVVWWIDTVFAADKMRGLFSIMFGASTLLVIQGALAKNESPARVHYARMITLLILGYAHYAFIWRSDILVLYACCGLLLFLFRNLSVRALWIWAAIFFLLGIGPPAFNLIPVGLAGYGLMPDPPAGLLEAYKEISLWVGPQSPQVANDLALHRSGYAELFHSRVFENTFNRFGMIAEEGAETVSLMLIGMALFRQALLTGGWTMRRYLRWAVVGIGVGAVANAALAAWQYSEGFAGYPMLVSHIILSMPFDFGMAIGYAALVAAWVKSSAPTALMKRVGASGRMAFTNYLMTSIIMTTIFYGYGLGLTGHLERAELFMVMLGMWALMLAWSKPWLDRFRYGPFEWLWRSMSRLELQPMRKGRVASPAAAAAA